MVHWSPTVVDSAGNSVEVFPDDEWEPASLPSDQRIWRYRGFLEFVSILQSESLWFNRADLFDDQFEGSLSRVNIENRPEYTERDGINEDILEQTYKAIRSLSWLNCWNSNDVESTAMWQQYGEKGVAIVSNPENIRRALSVDSSDYLAGKVSYVDYEVDEIPPNSVVSQFFHKRAAYIHEQEFRILYRPSGGQDHWEDISELYKASVTGHKVDIDVDELIDEVRISPFAPNYLQENVEGVIESFGYDIDVVPSAMNTEPYF